MALPIFLAEDDPALREQLIQAMDSICDAKVVATAETEAQATGWLSRHPHDWELGVLDLFLRQGTGIGVLRALNTPQERDRMVVLTNSASAENRATCLALGAHAVFDKTLELEDFLQHCRDCRDRQDRERGGKADERVQDKPEGKPEAKTS